MVSKYDVFYVLASQGEMRVTDIVRTLKRKQNEYRNIHNLVVGLEQDGYITRGKIVRLKDIPKTKKLGKIIVFCLKNGINYNTLLKKSMLHFLQQAAQFEFFTRKNIRIHQDTFADYVDILRSYGLLLIISRKPLTCKLLHHHILLEIFELFNLKTMFYNPHYRSFVSKIEREFRRFKRLSEAHGTLLMDIERKEEIKFIHISLSLEGNPITLPDTQRIILENLIPKKYSLVHIQEITNYKKAVDLMITKAQDKEILTFPLILEYHQSGMAHIYGAGELRKQNVRIKGNPHFKTCDWHLLSTKINELIKQYETFEEERNKKVKRIISFAAYFHNEFQRIHPFIDGNSRTSRLLMLHILRSYGLPVLDFPLGYFDTYLSLTKLSKHRDDKTFQNLIEEIVFFNLKKMNSVLA